MLVLLKSTAALPLVATMVRERCAPSFSAASQTCVYSVCCVLSLTASLDAFRRLNQSVSSLATSNWGVTASEPVPIRAPVRPWLPEGAGPEVTDDSTRRMAVVMSAGVRALMYSPRVLVAACQMSSTVLGLSFWRSGQLL
ncbi:hypothetical protein D3C71_851740 [compost metagenome]